jgi:hypothetical protein
MNTVCHDVSNSVCNGVTHAERNAVRRHVQNQNQNQTVVKAAFGFVSGHSCIASVRSVAREAVTMRCL